MKSCHEIQTRLLLKQSGEYHEEPNGPLALHLAGCEECRRFADDLRQLTAAAPGALEVDAPVYLRRVKLREKSVRFPLSIVWTRPWFGPAATAAVFALVVVLRVVLFRSPPTSDVRAPSPALLASFSSREALLREWHYWMAAGLGHDGTCDHLLPLNENGWSPSEMARQLLLFEGLGPDEAWGFEEMLWVEEAAGPPQDARAIGISSQQVV